MSSFCIVGVQRERRAVFNASDICSQSELNEYRTEGLMDDNVKQLYRENINRLRAEIDQMSRLKGNSHVINYEDRMILERENEIGWDILIRMEMLTPLSERLKKGMPVGDVVMSINGF